MTTERIRELVEVGCKDRFGSIEIIALDVHPGFGHAGDPIVTVRIVHDGQG